MPAVSFANTEENAFEALLPGLMIALQKTANSDTSTHANLKDFAKSITKLSTAAAGGKIVVSDDLQAITSQYKEAIDEIGVRGDNEAAEAVALSLKRDAALKATFLDDGGSGLTDYVRRMAIRIQVVVKRDCRSNATEQRFDVVAVAELLKPKGVWKRFSGPTDPAFVELNPGLWIFKASRDGQSIERGPYSIGVAGAPSTLDICLQ
jgi:hypothetical protein